MVICLERGADLHMAQLMPLPLTVQIDFSFLVPAHLGSPRQRAVKRVCVCVCVRLASYTICCRTSCTANWLYECLHYTTRCTTGCRTGSKVYTEFDCFVRYLWAVNLLCVMCSFGVRRAQRPMILHRKHYLVWKMDARIIGRQCRQSYTLLVMTAFVFKVVQYLCFIGSVFIVCWAVSI